MRLTRIYVAQPLAVADSVTLNERASHYLLRVLRLAVGGSLTLFNGDGNEYAGTVLIASKRSAEVLISGRQRALTESRLKITLAQAISKGERMDYCVQKATELGVHCIQPLLTRRVVVRLEQKWLAKRLARWRQVVVSACEQSGRALIPEVFDPMSLADWLAQAEHARRLILEPEAAQKLSDIALESEAVSVLIGPEGGFAAEEVQQAKDSGLTAVSLGPRVLRTESAGPAAIVVLQTLAGDF